MFGSEVIRKVQIFFYHPSYLYTKYEHCSSNGLQVINLTAMFDAFRAHVDRKLDSQHRAMLKQA